MNFPRRMPKIRISKIKISEIDMNRKLSIFKDNTYKFIRLILEELPLIVTGLFILYSIIPLIMNLLGNNSWIPAYLLIGEVLLFIVLFCTIVYFPLAIYAGYFYKHIISQSNLPNSLSKNNSKNHLAIVIVKYVLFSKSLFYLPMKFNVLFRKLKDNDIPFVVYVVKNKFELKKIIQNKNSKAVFIFAHGQKHGIRFDGDRLFYCEIPKNENIELVGQFHCNHLQGKAFHNHMNCDGILSEDRTIYPEINDFIASNIYLVKLKKIFKKN